LTVGLGVFVETLALLRESALLQKTHGLLSVIKFGNFGSEFHQKRWRNCQCLLPI